MSAQYIDSEQVIADMGSPLDVKFGDYDSYTNTDYGKGICNIKNYMSDQASGFGKNITYIQPQYPEDNSPYRAIVKGDDPIISLIPKELFMHRGKYTYIGKEYGFHINTQRAASNYTMNSTLEGYQVVTI